MKNNELIHCLKPLDPEEIIQFGILKMSVSLKEIIDNYKGDDKIVNKLSLDVENVLDLDRTVNAKFEFLHYG